MPTSFQLNEAGELWFEHLARFTWQSALLVLVVTAAIQWFRSAPPRIRCWLWRLVALKLLLMPFWTIAVESPVWIATTNSRPIAEASVAPTASETPRLLEAPELSPTALTEPVPVVAHSPRWWRQLSWQTWLLAVWVAGVLWHVSRIVRQRRELQRLLRDTQFAEPHHVHLVDECAKKLGLIHSPQVRATAVEISPFVCGVRRPSLVLPVSLLNEVEPEQLRQIVLHELAHLKRRDLIWCWITQLMLACYWFHPVAYWIAYQEQLERELACDHEAMIASGTQAKEYAATLVEVVTKSASFPLARAAMTARFDGGHEA